MFLLCTRYLGLLRGLIAQDALVVVIMRHIWLVEIVARGWVCVAEISVLFRWQLAILVVDYMSAHLTYRHESSIIVLALTYLSVTLSHSLFLFCTLMVFLYLLDLEGWDMVGIVMLRVRWVFWDYHCGLEGFRSEYLARCWPTTGLWWRVAWLEGRRRLQYFLSQSDRIFCEILLRYHQIGESGAGTWVFFRFELCRLVIVAFHWERLILLIH